MRPVVWGVLLAKGLHCMDAPAPLASQQAPRPACPWEGGLCYPPPQSLLLKGGYTSGGRPGLVFLGCGEHSSPLPMTGSLRDPRACSPGSRGAPQDPRDAVSKEEREHPENDSPLRASVVSHLGPPRWYTW